MKDREILDHIKNSIDGAPIDLLDTIKSQQVVKMLKHDDITRQSKVSFKPIMSFLSAAAVFMLVFFNFQQLRLPDSQIYLDVNPGIQITTNKKDKVIKLEPINKDAKDIIENIEFKNQELDVVTGNILDSLVGKAYLNEDSDVMLVSVYNKDSEKSKRQVSELNDLIHSKFNDKHPILLSQSLDSSDTVDEFAKKYGVSVGKMTFIRNMIILNPDLKTEDLVNLSLNRLIEISRNTGIDIERIIDSEDYERIKNQPRNELIGQARAKEIALGLVNGRIIKFKLDDDMEYEIDIRANNFIYEIEIDGYTGKVLKFEKDDIDDDFDDDKDEDDDLDYDDDDEYDDLDDDDFEDVYGEDDDKDDDDHEEDDDNDDDDDEDDD